MKHSGELKSLITVFWYSGSPKEKKCIAQTAVLGILKHSIKTSLVFSKFWLSFQNIFLKYYDSVIKLPSSSLPALLTRGVAVKTGEHFARSKSLEPP